MKGVWDLKGIWILKGIWVLKMKNRQSSTCGTQAPDCQYQDIQCLWGDGWGIKKKLSWSSSRDLQLLCHLGKSFQHFSLSDWAYTVYLGCLVWPLDVRVHGEPIIIVISIARWVKYRPRGLSASFSFWILSLLAVTLEQSTNLSVFVCKMEIINNT